MKAAQEVDLGKEAVKKLFFMLAIPAILSQLVNALYLSLIHILISLSAAVFQRRLSKH